MATKTATAAYDAFAPFYDRFTAHHDYELWTSGLLRLAYEHGLTGNRVLDAGCGTGKSFIPLVERGFEVTACDQSPAMLALGASKTGGAVELHCRDLRELDSLVEFDLITCLDDVANYLPDLHELGMALAGMAGNLRPGGGARLRHEHAQDVPDLLQRHRVVEEPGLVMVWRGLAGVDFAPGGLARATLEVFSEGPAEGEWSRSTIDHEQRHHPRSTVDRCGDCGGPPLSRRVRAGPRRQLRRRARRAQPYEGRVPAESVSPVSEGGENVLKVEKLEKPLVPAVSVVKGG